MSLLPAELSQPIDAFEAIPADAAHGDERKQAVRALEARVREGSVALTQPQFLAAERDDRALARILTYLLVEHGRVPGDLAARRAGVVHERERLQRVRFARGSSTMPLYYAVRSYLGALKASGAAVEAARADRVLFVQLEAELREHGLDRGRQVQHAIGEILGLLETPAMRSEDRPSNVARISRRGVLAQAVIGAIALLLVGVLANWDRLFGRARASAPADSSRAVAVPRSP